MKRKRKKKKKQEIFLSYLSSIPSFPSTPSPSLLHLLSLLHLVDQQVTLSLRCQPVHSHGTVPPVPTIPAHHTCSTSGSERSSQSSSSLSALSPPLLRRSSSAKPHPTDSFIICIVVHYSSRLAVASLRRRSLRLQISLEKSHPALPTLVWSRSRGKSGIQISPPVDLATLVSLLVATIVTGTSSKNGKGIDVSL